MSYDLKRAADARLKELPAIAQSFGLKEANCPTCDNDLPKFPKRKIKCKNCSNPVYPRKNPVTGKVVLISEDAFDLFFELTAYANGTWDSWFANHYELETIRAQLGKEWGLNDASKVPVDDAEWRRITMKANESLACSDWVGYMSARDSGIRFLSRERRYREAIPLACEYIYLAYNVNQMERAYELAGIPEDMRTPIGPLKMHGPQVVMIDMVQPDIEKLRIAYMEEMTQTGLHRAFGMSPEEAFDRYRQERDEHYEALRNSGHLDDYLATLERNHGEAN